MSQLKINLTPETSRACVMILQGSYPVTYQAYLSDGTVNSDQFSPNTSYYLVSGLDDWTEFSQAIQQQNPSATVEII